MKEIKKHILWGKKVKENQVEQGGILIGKVIKCERKINYGIVENAIPGTLAKGTSAYLEMNHKTWKEMIDEVDKIIDDHPKEQLQIIGWYHTHPNNLSIFMSGTDRNTQCSFFPNHWQFAVVLNPHKKIWGAFYGKDSKKCNGFIVAKY